MFEKLSKADFGLEKKRKNIYISVYDNHHPFNLGMLSENSWVTLDILYTIQPIKKCYSNFQPAWDILLLWKKKKRCKGPFYVRLCTHGKHMDSRASKKYDNSNIMIPAAAVLHAGRRCH